MCTGPKRHKQTYPGFLPQLQNAIQDFSLDQLERVTRFGGLDIHDLIDLSVNPQDYSVDAPQAVVEDEVIKYDQVDKSLKDRGDALINDNKIAFLILAGGVGTRIGKPKALLEIPGTNDTLLTHKLKSSKSIKNVWVLVGPEISAQVKQHLRDVGLEREGLHVIEQFESVRLNSINNIFLNNNKPSFYPTGHGDAIPAMIHSNRLKEFLDAGGKHIFVSNVDNFAALPDSLICGLHDHSEKAVTCEVVQREENDSGGFLCNHMGINQIVEAFRLLPGTETTHLNWLNTNTMIFRADLPFDAIKWSWHRVKKVVDGNVAVQYERLINQLTEVFDTQFIEVQRQNRFLPVKTVEDLKLIVST